ncbi:unnamed protein product [Oncorhynchus mykiss]|uniref:Uncharacterized protein n=1 Tax=Oncorhynchus mykiss TaxID=8022 RepID=A0A060Z0S4_ONCMY|nr:unnamed protein product [Oncorhynchus mykiss]
MTLPFASGLAIQSDSLKVTEKDEEPIGDRWDDEDWGSLEDAEKVQAADPDDWNSSDWSGMSSVKKASVRGVSLASSEAVKKQSSDWSSSGWDADDSWSNEKEADIQGQSSPGEDGWGNDWEEEGRTAPATKSAALPEGVRLASEYDWDIKGDTQTDFLANVSQRATPTPTAMVGDGWSAEPAGDWGAEESWQSVGGSPAGLTKAELAKKKREERRKELEAKRAERKAAKGPLKLGARKLD